MLMKSIILAAGQGSRMKSDTPKPLLEIGGKPMLRHVIDVLKTTFKLEADDINVVYSQAAIAVKDADYDDVIYSEQKSPNGTGDAVLSAVVANPVLSDDVLILYGDVPLITPETLNGLAAVKGEADLALLTVRLEDPTGYGRIMRSDKGAIVGIVEQKDANEEQQSINEVNTGIMLVSGDKLTDWVSSITDENAQNEYYLTDIVEMAYREGKVASFTTDDENEVAGANDRVQMAELEVVYQERQITDAMINGLAVLDPSRVDIRGELEFGRNCQVDVNVIFKGSVTLGRNVKVGPGAILEDCSIPDDTIINPYTLIKGNNVGQTTVSGSLAKTNK
jgi:bifunctional UDP-N-acetylglucosamine pyrophosphorylase/glucosamine-1-phosphate N-acetyltransferase